MICKKCSTENPENAVFCRHCGKRLDGTVICPSCKTINDEEANFCIACGQKLTDAKICSECGETYRGNFCPKCGTTATPPAKPTKRQRTVAEESTEKSSGWRKVLEYVAGGLCMGAVFFALLFTFLIGTGISAGTTNAGVSMYYYFGDVYESISTALAEVDVYDAGYELALYMPAVLSTLIVAATIITVVTFATLACVRYVRNVLGKTKKDYAAFAVAAVLSYLAGAVGLNALTAASTTVSSSGVSVTTGMGYNAATIAGIVLSVIFLAVFLGCRIAINAKNIWQNKRIVTLCLSAGGAVLFGVALQFLSGTVASVRFDEYSPSMSVGGGYNALIERFCGCVTRHKDLKTIVTFTEEEAVVLILSLVGMTVQIAATVFTALTLARFLSNLAGKKGKGNLSFAIVAEVLALIHLILVIVTTVQYTNVLHMQDAYVWNYTPVICGLVFTTLALADAIVHKVFLRKEAKEEFQD